MVRAMNVCPRVAFLTILLLSASGCLRTLGPKPPKEISSPPGVAYGQAEFKADVDAYRAAVTNGNLTQAKALRNQIAYRVMGDVEWSYQRFETSLTANRAAIETGSDVTQLGLTAAIAVTGVGDVKDILAASLAGFQGTRLSFDKNYFQEKTTEAIISQMRADRKTIQAQLILSLGTRDVVSYPLDSCWLDLVDYYYAGTVPSALVGIAGRAGADAKIASAKVAEAVDALTPATPAQAKKAVNIRSAYEKLSKEVASQNKSESEAAIQTLRAVLTKIGRKPEANVTPEDLLASLRQAMLEANYDNAKLAALNDALMEGTVSH